MNKYFVFLTILVVALAGCKKDIVNKSSALQNTQAQSRSIAQADEASPTFIVVDNGDGTFTATLQPDDTNGQDVLVSKLIGSPDWADANANWQPEIDMTAWTNGGSPVYLRSYLRFVDLEKIPSTANVLSATLYLYGVSSSIASPQGNSTFPGSPYTSYGTNRCIIEPVNGPWDEATLTWNTQPRVKTEWGKVSLPASTSQWNYDVALSDVKGMIARAIRFPAKNYGVRISLANETYYRSITFASSESSDLNKRPKLVVTYSN